MPATGLNVGMASPEPMVYSADEIELLVFPEAVACDLMYPVEFTTIEVAGTDGVQVFTVSKQARVVTPVSSGPGRMVTFCGPA